MMSDTGGPEFSNGTYRAANGGSRGLEELAARTSNGTHKPAFESANGSSQNGATAVTGTGTGHDGTYFGHDREEVTRILIQALADMGYTTAADSVSRDSGFQLEGPTVAAFRTAVLYGAWNRAEELLAGAVYAGDRQPGNGLVLAPGADRNIMRIWIKQQKYLELLERRDNNRALAVLRSELTPLCNEQTLRLRYLSNLLMCDRPEDLRDNAGWDGARGQSRQVLLSELSRCISPSVMLPEHRLAVLLGQVKESQISNCLFHTSAQSPSLYADHVCDQSQFPSELLLELDEHSSEVWQVAFSHNGSRLASCGEDDYVSVWKVPSFEQLHNLAVAQNGKGVGNLAWSPDDTKLVTCGRDHLAKIWDAKTGELLHTLERFDEPVSSCVWAVDGKSLLLGSFDKERGIVQFSAEGQKIFTWTKKHRTEDLAISPDGQWLVAMDDQKQLHIYNYPNRELEYDIAMKIRPTSVAISCDSRVLLVNKVDGEAELIEIVTRDSIQKYSGASGGEYLIRNAFGGANESFVISGSDEGSIYVWHKLTGILVKKLEEAHHPRCNAVSWNPRDPCMFASCGDDNKIKIWSNKERLRNFDPPSNSTGTNGWARLGERHDLS